MAPVAGVPFLQILLARLRAQGIGEVILGTGYLAEQVEAHFGDGQAFGLTIAYSRESAPLGTGGALKLAEKQLSDPVLILNGDSFVEWELASLVARFEEKKADLVMALQAVSEVTRYGSVTQLLHGAVYGVVSEGLFIDIGVPEDLAHAQTLLA